jgi:hypothetical protein
MDQWAAYLGKNVFLLDVDLRSPAPRLSLYESVSDDPAPTAITIHRPPNQPAVVAPRATSRRADGCMLVEAQSAPGSQVWYDYLLLKEVATVDRATGDVTPLQRGGTIGVTPSDCLEVAPNPGLFYVTAHSDAGMAFLLGPFTRHIDALLRVARVSAHLRDAIPAAQWWAYGTSRLNPEADQRAGRLNVELLSAEEAVLLAPVLRQGDELPEFCFVFNPDAEPGKFVTAVRRGASGYFSTTYDEPDPEKARGLVVELNTRLGVSEEEAERMFAGSMFGWNVPAAKPASARLKARG